MNNALSIEDVEKKAILNAKVDYLEYLLRTHQAKHPTEVTYYYFAFAKTIDLSIIDKELFKQRFTFRPPSPYDVSMPEEVNKIRICLKKHQYLQNADFDWLKIIDNEKVISDNLESVDMNRTYLELHKTFDELSKYATFSLNPIQQIILAGFRYRNKIDRKLLLQEIDLDEAKAFNKGEKDDFLKDAIMLPFLNTKALERISNQLDIITTENICPIICNFPEVAIKLLSFKIESMLQKCIYICYPDVHDLIN